LLKSFEGALGTEDLSTWNVTKVSNPSATEDDIILLSQKALARRLEAISRTADDNQPLRITVDAKGTFRLLPLRALAVDWTPYFADSTPNREEWGLMANAWTDVSRFVKNLLLPTKSIHLTGTPSLPSALLMGSRFSTRDGMVPSWVQGMPDGVSYEQWTHNSIQSSKLAQELGWSTFLQHRNTNASALAVLINASDNTELAIGRSRAALPEWRAVLAVNPPDARNTRMLPLSVTEVASVVHLTIDALRNARQNVQPIDSIHLFVAGPAGIGVLLGAQLATLPPVTTYEFDTTRQMYVEAILITS
jgi:hypothetical protein